MLDYQLVRFYDTRIFGHIIVNFLFYVVVFISS